MQTQDIQWWVEALSQDEAEECLANLRELAHQVDGAMDAIVRRQLPALQTSLHRQQANCAGLADIRYRSKARLAQDCGAKTATIDSDLAAEIKSATESLLVLNRRYSALLKHSEDTLRLLAGLYRSYRGSVQPASGLQRNLHTWSCEV